MPKKSVMQCSTTRISKYVKQHPGMQSREIADALNINIQTARVTLSKLLSTGRISRTASKPFKYYSPSVMPCNTATAKSRVLACVQRHSGLRTTEIARELNIRPATVSTSLSVLVREGRVSQERDSEYTRFYPVMELSIPLGFGVSPGMQFLNDRLAEVRA